MKIPGCISVYMPPWLASARWTSPSHSWSLCTLAIGKRRTDSVLVLRVPPHTSGVTHTSRAKIRELSSKSAFLLYVKTHYSLLMHLLVLRWKKTLLKQFTSSLLPQQYKSKYTVHYSKLFIIIIKYWNILFCLSLAFISLSSSLFLFHLSHFATFLSIPDQAHHNSACRFISLLFILL